MLNIKFLALWAVSLALASVALISILTASN
jgi:hypothetical protein